jgi:hypothetical protein
MAGGKVCDMRHWYLSLALALLACSGDDPKECIPGEQQGLVVCSDDGQWEKHELPMASFASGNCTFNAGSYVVTYKVLDSTSSCGAMEPAPNEYLTVTAGTELAWDPTSPDDCVDTDPAIDGCRLTFKRSCTLQTDQGRVETRGTYEYDYADGSGLIQTTASLYRGTLLDSTCVFTNEATMSRR